MSHLEKLLSSNSLEFKQPIAYSNSNQGETLKSVRESYPDFTIELKNPTVTDSIKVNREEDAEVLFLVDVSGSIDTKTKEHFAGIQEGIIKSLREKYEHVSHGVILHHTKAKTPVTGFDWIEDAETGGTIVSSAYKEAEKHIISSETDYYIVQLTDGDNWADDTPVTDKYVNKLAIAGVKGFKYFEVTSRPTQALHKAMSKNDCVEVFRMRTGSLAITQ